MRETKERRGRRPNPNRTAKKKRPLREFSKKKGPIRKPKEKQRNVKRVQRPRRSRRGRVPDPTIDAILSHQVARSFYSCLADPFRGYTDAFIPISETGCAHFLQRYYLNTTIRPPVNFTTSIKSVTLSIIPWNAGYFEDTDNTFQSVGAWLFNQQATTSFSDASGDYLAINIAMDPVMVVACWVDAGGRNLRTVHNFLNSSATSSPNWPAGLPRNEILESGTDFRYMQSRTVAAGLSVQPVNKWSNVLGWAGQFPTLTDSFLPGLGTKGTQWSVTGAGGRLDDKANRVPCVPGGFVPQFGPTLTPQLVARDFSAYGDMADTEALYATLGPWNYRDESSYVRVKSPDELYLSSYEPVNVNVPVATELISVPFVHLEFNLSSLVTALADPNTYALELDTSLLRDVTMTQANLMQGETIEFIPNVNELVRFCKGHMPEAHYGARLHANMIRPFTGGNASSQDVRLEYELNRAVGFNESKSDSGVEV